MSKNYVKRDCFIKNACLIIEQHDVEKVEGVIVSDEVVASESYQLEEANYQGIKKARASKKPLIVFKMDDKLYYAFIPKSLSLLSTNMLGAEHACAHGTCECRHLRALPEPEGCRKVLREHIEDIPYIRVGYETSNTWENVFQVSVCSRCEYYE